MEVWPSTVIQEFRRICRVWKSVRFYDCFGFVYMRAFVIDYYKLLWTLMD